MRRGGRADEREGGAFAMYGNCEGRVVLSREEQLTISLR
jgi:hypothetical protein